MTANRCLILVVLAVLLFLSATLPAHAEPAPENHVNPDGTAILYVYPKVPQMREGDKIIEVAHPPLPEDDISPDPFERAKDPRTWA